MKQLLIFILLLCSLPAVSQNIGWQDLFLQPFYRNGLKTKRVYLPPQPQTITDDDTASGYIYSRDTNVLYRYKGKDYNLSGGSTTVNNNGGTLTQDAKDTTITWNGAKIYADIPSGITYTPINIEITITQATSTEGDTGEGYSYSFNTVTKVLRIIYPSAAPIGTFKYHIVFTKSS